MKRSRAKQVRKLYWYFGAVENWPRWAKRIFNPGGRR